MNLQAKDEKAKNDRAKRAVALAMNNRWEEAVALNQAIARDFPEDIGAYNRLGKALSELGRNKEAQEAFRLVLKRSPNNAIAKKNLSRLMKLADADAPRASRGPSRRRSKTFIEESGNAGVTSLIKLAPPETLVKLTPGDAVRLGPVGSGLIVRDGTGAYIGQVEPRVGTRIARLARGGNLYEAAVTSVEERELVIIIRETYKTPAQSGIVSFPSRGGTNYKVYVPSAVMGFEVGDDDDEERELAVVAAKDWSDDDTEPGDDEAFAPVIHRIINSPAADIEPPDDF